MDLSKAFDTIDYDKFLCKAALKKWSKLKHHLVIYLQYQKQSDIRSIETREAVNKFYESITDKGWSVDKNAPLNYKAMFIRDPKTKQLYAMYKDKQIKFTSLNPNKFLALHTIMQNFGKNGVAFVRDVL